MSYEDREWRQVFEPLRSDDGAGAEVERRLISAVRRRRRVRRAFWAAAMAAMCLPLLLLFPAKHSVPARPAVEEASPAPVATSAPAIPAEAPAEPRLAVHRAPRAAAPAVPHGKAEQTPSMTFVALPSTLMPGPIIRGQVVRVRLAGGALADLGFDVSQDRLSQPVFADVLLDEDGTPAALRVVPPEAMSNGRAHRIQEPF